MSDTRDDSAERRRAWRNLRRLGAVGALLLTAALGISAARSGAWNEYRLRHMPPAELEALAAANPVSGRVQRAWGERLLRQGELPTAERTFQRAVEADPTDPRAWTGWGSAALALGKPQPAVEILKRATDQWPEHAEAQFGLAAAYADLGDLDSSVRHLREGLLRSPGNADAWGTLGTLLERLGRPEEAEAAYRTLQKLRPRELLTGVSRARCLVRLGRWREARPLLVAALEEYPSHLEARMLLAETHVAQGDAASRGVGMKELARAGAFHPEAAAAPRRIGELWMETEEYADAAQSFARAADLEPGDETHLEKAAAAYRLLKQPDRAQLYEQRAVEIRDLKQELARLETAMRAAPADPRPLLQHAAICLRLKWNREAAQDYRRVLHLQPAHPEARQRLPALERLLRTQEEEGQVITGRG